MASVTDARVVGNVVTARCMTDREAASGGCKKRRRTKGAWLSLSGVHFTTRIGMGVDFNRRRARKTKDRANPLGI